MMVAMSLREAWLRRASSSASLMPVPAARTSSRPVALELPDVLQGRETFGGGGLADDVFVVGGFAERGDGARVAEVPGHLRGRGGLVDRNGHGAGKPDGEVDQGPFVARAGHDAHAVAGRDAVGHEALGEGGDVRQEIRGPDVLPLARGVKAGEQGRVGWPWPPGAARRSVMLVSGATSTRGGTLNSRTIAPLISVGTQGYG